MNKLKTNKNTNDFEQVSTSIWVLHGEYYLLSFVLIKE